MNPRGKNLPSWYLKSGDDTANVVYVMRSRQSILRCCRKSYTVAQYIGAFRFAFAYCNSVYIRKRRNYHSARWTAHLCFYCSTAVRIQYRDCVVSGPNS